MDVQTAIPDGAEFVEVWQWPDGKQLLGPGLIGIALLEPDEEASPWPLQLYAALAEDGHYVITRLDIRADAMAHQAGHLTQPVRLAQLSPSPDLPPITARAVGQISLPAILRRGLYGKFRTRVRNADGDLVDGAPDDNAADMIYMRARALGLDPTAEVARRLNISPAAAAQRVARARKQGLIPPTTQGAR